MRRFLAPAIVLLLLVGCGFHLQGPPPVPPAMQQTAIVTDDEHSEFYWALRRELASAGVEIVPAHTAGAAIFTIYVDETNQRVLSVSARNVPTEFEVYYTIRYGVTEGQNTLLDVQDLTLTRDYTYDSTEVLGKAHEEQVLREQIVEDLVRIALQQVAAQ